jgi:hypothetical protein
MWNDAEWATKEEWDAYAWFGFAVSEAQMLEKQLLVMAVALALGEEVGDRSENSWYSLYDRLGRLHLKSLLDRVRRHATLPDDLVERLEAARKVRNALAHEFFWRRGNPEDTDRSLDIARQELVEAASLFSSLSGPLLLATDSLLENLRLDRHAIDDKAASLLTQP